MPLEKLCTSETSFESTIAGMPCIIRIDTYRITRGSYSPCAETPEDYYGEHDVEFTVFDRKGYIANWLERKMNEKYNTDYDRIMGEIDKHIAYISDPY